jgi:hypothetical protein
VNRFDPQIQGPCGFADNATSVAHKPHKANSRNKQKRTSDVLQNPDNLKKLPTRATSA